MGGRFGTGLIAGVFAGLLAGWMLGQVGQSRLRAPEPEAPTVETSSTLAAPAPMPDERQRPALREAASGEAPAIPEEAESDAELLTDALRDLARAEIARGWSSVRSDAIPEAQAAEGLVEFGRAVRSMPWHIGKSLAEEANEAEQEHETPPEVEEADALEAHDPIALLDHMDSDHGFPKPRLELVNDAAGFAQLFAGSAGKALDGASNVENPDEVIEDGTVLDFPAGVFRLRQLMQRKDPFPRDVTLRGAGMDATLLLLSDLSTRGELRNFALRDCTVFTDNSLFDLRHRPASVLLERVRLTGFDTGAGGSSLLDAPGLALLARACRFEGGYGRAPWYANLFDVRSNALLARFEGCWVDQVNEPSMFLHRGASVAFVDCRLTNLLNRVEGDVHPGVVYPGSTVTFFPGERTDAPHKDLNALFPDWEKRVQQ